MSDELKTATPDMALIGRPQYRIFLQELHRPNGMDAIKALYNAGYRGPELRLDGEPWRMT